MLKATGLLAILTVVLLLSGCVRAEKENSLMAFVGSASKPPLEEAAKAFYDETGIKVYLNFGGSGTLLSQIELSRSGDVYIPGSPDYIVKAERKGLVDTNSVRRIAYLIPTIGVPKGNPKNISSLDDLARPGLKVGIGNPQAVCLGLYAVELFEYNGILEKVKPNIIVEAKSCEDTAALLSLGTVDAIIGWDVFQHWDPDNIEVVYLKPEELPRIAYVPAAIVKFTQDRSTAEKFLDFLTSARVQATFQKWGYIADESKAREFAPNAEIGGEYQPPEGLRWGQ